MTGSLSPATAAAVLRFHLRPVRHLVSTAVHGSSARGRTWDVTIGPVDVRGRSIVLRTPRFTDWAQWRAVRMRNQKNIEPWWVTSPLSWSERHTEGQWVSALLHQRRTALRGEAMPLVVEVDGMFAGESNLERIDAHSGIGEMGCWLDARIPARAAVVAAAGSLLIEHAFTDLGLHRLSAPIGDGNGAAMLAARRIGMVYEGTMEQFLDVGGRRRSHHLWAITADQWQQGRYQDPVPVGIAERRASVG